MKNLIILITYICLSVAFAQKPKETTHRGVGLSADVSIYDLVAARDYDINIFRYPLYIPEMTNENFDIVYQKTKTKIDYVLRFCQKYGIEMVIDLHNPPGGITYIGDRRVSTLFINRSYYNLTLRFWKQIFIDYRDQSNIYAMEALSEPAIGDFCKDCVSLKKFYRRFINILARIDKKKRYIIAPPFGDVNQTHLFRTSKNKNEIVSFHVYYPMHFTHQLPPNDPVEYGTNKLNREDMERYLSRIRYFQRKNHGVKIHIGEFSVYNEAMNDSAHLWLLDTISVFEKYKWNWTYHAFREADVWDFEKTETTYSVMTEFFKRNW